MTDLAFDGIHIAPQSARGLTQTLEPIDQSKHTQRTLNGSLKDTAAPQFRKYRSTITCSDMNALSFDSNWPGKSIVVDCVVELSFKTIGGSQGRIAVAGSTRISGDTTFYCPQLTMRVMNLSMQEDDYGKVVSWSLELEEI